jgi:hypothetical protein
MGHFTYVGRETKYIVKLFKHTDLNIAYHTNKGLLAHLNCHTQIPDKFTLSGVYKLTCPDCGRASVGQTGRDLRTRFDEHRCAFLYNNQSSKFAQHLLQHAHSLDTYRTLCKYYNYRKKAPT